MNLRFLKLAQLLIFAILFNTSSYAAPYGIRGEVVPDTDTTLEKQMQSHKQNQKTRLAHPVRRTPAIEKEKIKVSSVWCKPSIGNNPNSACYITLHNTHEHPIEIRRMMIYPSKKDIHFPVAKLIEFRTVIRDVDGKSKSVPIGKASIPADEKLVLKTGGNHLFLGGLRQTLEVGKTLFMHIQVRHLNGPLEIEVPISYKEPK